MNYFLHLNHCKHSFKIGMLRNKLNSPEERGLKTWPAQRSSRFQLKNGKTENSEQREHFAPLFLLLFSIVSIDSRRTKRKVECDMSIPDAFNDARQLLGIFILTCFASYTG